MANIQHSSLTDSDGLHEPKGVATATSGDVYVADGAGSGSWDPLEGTEVYSTGHPLHWRDGERQVPGRRRRQH
jgi:hypothetical protein